jgi:hypothetical protein
MPSNVPLLIQQLFDDNLESLRLGWLAGHAGNGRVIYGDAA